MIIAGSHLYENCADCGKLVRVNKPIFGSLHVCLSSEERAMKEIYSKRQPPPPEWMKNPLNR